jgi:hypothetical protein
MGHSLQGDEVSAIAVTKAERSPGGVKMSQRCVHEGTERWLHVATAHGRALKVVVYNNGLIYLHDCVYSMSEVDG